MNNSHWKLCDGAYEAVRLLAHRNSVIVELGSGEGTERLARLGKLFSVEHDERWLLNFPGVKYIHAPLVEIIPPLGFEHLQWYDPDILETGLPSHCDIVIVDGPPGVVGRSGLLHHLSLFPEKVTWIIDDTQREEECRLADHIALSRSLHIHRFWNFTIISPEPLDPATATIILGASWRELRSENEEWVKTFFPGWVGEC